MRREVIKSHIRNCILTGFDIYMDSGKEGLEDATIFEGIYIDETNGLLILVIPFNEPDNLQRKIRNNSL